MKVFPPSPELKSGKYYMCGVDVCEEGVQFCNLDDRRCEYCADHHQDCFTYIQQQNCTQFCQDQWRKNLLDNCTVCESVECEGILVYKILSAITSFLLLIAIFVIILQEKRTRRALKRVVLFFIPDQIVSAIQQLFKRNTTALRNDQEHNIRQNNIRPTLLERTSIEDLENFREKNDSRGEESEQSEIQKLTKRKQSVNHDTAKSTSIGTNGLDDDLKKKRESENISTVITQSQPETFDSASSKKPAEKDAESGEALHDVVNGTQTAEKATKSNLDKNQAKAEFRKGDEVKMSQTNEETELLKLFPQIHDSEDIHVSDVIQSDQSFYIPPHGELSTMSSRGGYQAMSRSSNQSTDNGYVTTVTNKSTSNL